MQRRTAVLTALAVAAACWVALLWPRSTIVRTALEPRLAPRDTPQGAAAVIAQPRERRPPSVPLEQTPEVHVVRAPDGPDSLPFPYDPDVELALDVDEDELMRAEDNSPEQRIWRKAFAKEQQDDAWTASMELEIERKASALLQGEVQVHDLSCRETICRMFMKFDDDVDAKAFRNAPHDSSLHYEFQSFDPSYHGEGFDRSDYSYEVMVKRVAPAHLADVASAKLHAAP